VLRWLVALVAGAAFAQDTGTVHEAPYIPTPPATVQEMLRLASVGPADVVYDLGSGDGRVVIAAARDFGARSVGVERDAKLVALSRDLAARAGVAERTRFLQQDIFATSLAEATVVAIYLSPNLNLKLRPSLLALKPGTRVVSHGSDMGDWKPDRATAIRKDVRLWVVPAQVAGRWRSALGARPLELEFRQRYQEVSADARLAGAPAQVWEARLAGDALSFVIVEAVGSAEEKALYFEGKVGGGRIEGSVTRGAGRTKETLPWRAERL
jgi:SAM-dependent methyltransferase